jgi:hypothetical protein
MLTLKPIMCDTASAIDLTAISDDEESVVILIRHMLACLVGKGDDFEMMMKRDDMKRMMVTSGVSNPAPFFWKGLRMKNHFRVSEESEWFSSDRRGCC